MSMYNVGIDEAEIEEGGVIAMGQIDKREIVRLTSLASCAG